MLALAQRALQVADRKTQPAYFFAVPFALHGNNLANRFEQIRDPMIKQLFDKCADRGIVGGAARSPYRGLFCWGQLRDLQHYLLRPQARRTRRLILLLGHPFAAELFEVIAARDGIAQRVSKAYHPVTVTQLSAPGTRKLQAHGMTSLNPMLSVCHKLRTGAATVFGVPTDAIGSGTASSM